MLKITLIFIDKDERFLEKDKTIMSFVWGCDGIIFANTRMSRHFKALAARKQTNWAFPPMNSPSQHHEGKQPAI